MANLTQKRRLMEMNKQQIISFHSNLPSQGQRTVSLAFSNLLAQQGYDVLYIELDTNYPSIAKALQLNTGEKNMTSYLEQTVNGEFDAIEKFILRKEDLVSQNDRKQKSRYAEFEENLAYLIFPLSTKTEDIPNLLEYRQDDETDEEFAIDYVSRLIEAIGNTSYDFVVCKLANDIDHLFTYEMMKLSNHVVSVSLPSVTKLFDQEDLKSFLFAQDKELQGKWHDVLNMTSSELDESEYKNLIDAHCIIPFDPERQGEELALNPDSPKIRQKLERFVLDLGIKINVTVDENRSIFKKVFKRQEV